MPEIDIPGHSGAAAVAYPEILCEGNQLGQRVVRRPRGELQDAGCDGGRACAALPLRVHPRRRRRGRTMHAWANCPRCKALMQRAEADVAGPYPRPFHSPLRGDPAEARPQDDRLERDPQRQAVEGFGHRLLDRRRPGYRGGGRRLERRLCPRPALLLRHEGIAPRHLGHPGPASIPLVESVCLRSARPRRA